LDVKVWELNTVPFHWRAKARVVNAGKMEAKIELAKKMHAQGVYVIEL